MARHGDVELEQTATHCIAFDRYVPDEQRQRESLLGLGNGVLFVRACAPEAAFLTCRSDRHYAGLYAAGTYNHAQRDINGKQVGITSLVNLPDPFALSFRPEDENAASWFDLHDCEVLRYSHRLDMAAATAVRELIVRDPQGRESRLVETRFVSMVRSRLVALEWQLTPLNWSGWVCVRSLLRTSACNALLSRTRAYEGRHLTVEPIECDDGLAVLARTTDGSRCIGIRARLHLDGARDRQRGRSEGALWQQARVIARAHEPVVVRLWTEVDPDGQLPDDPLPATLSEALDEHRVAWSALWHKVAIHAPTDAKLERSCRFGAFHLLQTASPLSAARDVGLPARGWQEAYFGHIFWDDLAAFPFYSMRLPAVARSLLEYRARRLDAALRAAARAGRRGAMFPWRSAATGDEETPPYQWIPPSRRWKPDHTHLQHHVGSAIALNAWRYYLASGDRDLLLHQTGRMLLEIARFWASRAERDPGAERAHVRRVIGPDEYHDAYPGAMQPGLNDNAYTNVMAAWTLRCAVDLPRHVDDSAWATIAAQAALAPAELGHWDRLSRDLYVPLLDGDVIAQFEGFDALLPADARPSSERKPRTRADWWLDARDDDINAYQTTKQADVLMLFHLLGRTQLSSLLERLGYRLAGGWYERTVRYYLTRISHESSLSRFVCAGALACMDSDASWDYFQQAMDTDLQIEASTHEGLHLGAMAGTWDVLQRHYFGLEIASDRVIVEPQPPAALDDVTIEVCVRGSRISLRLRDRWLYLRLEEGPAVALSLEHRGELRQVAVGSTTKLACR